MSAKITIAIADDHPMIIDGLKNILQLYPHIILTGSYLNGEALLEGLENVSPDVLLLDIQLPGKTGDELAPIILKKYPDIKILTLTNFDNALYANKMFQQGVHGYILKTADRYMLIKAIETIYEGGQFIEDKIKQKIQELDVRHKFTSKISLTQREKEVLKLIISGLDTTEISSNLYLSINTVKTYRKSIFQKLQVNNVASLVQKALKMGLTDEQ